MKQGLKAAASIAFLWLALVSVACGRRESTPPPDLAPETIFHSGKIFTAAPSNEFRQAVAVRDGKIAAVGADREILDLAASNTRLVDLGGRTMLPGFNDNHVHLGGGPGGFQEWEGGLIAAVPDWIRGATTMQTLQGAIRDKAAETPPGEWIVGALSREIWPNQKIPDRWDLDEGTRRHPVLLRRGPHTTVLNSAALELARIDRLTESPAGGEVAKDDNGEPTGRLFDAAQRLVAGIAPAADEEPSDESAAGRGADEAAIDNMRRTLLEFAGTGVTSVNIAGMRPQDFRLLQALYERHGGELPRATMQVRLYPGYDRYDDLAEGVRESIAELEGIGFTTGFGNDRLKIGAIKMSIDGGLSAPAYWSLEPYENRPDFTGVVRIPAEAFYPVARRAHELGWQLGIHTIGDGAVEMVVDQLERILEELPRADHRHYLHHVAVKPPADTIAKMARLGIGVASQPSFTVGLGAYAVESLAGEREATMNPTRSLLDAGVHVSWGSDGAPYGPRVSLWTGITRKGWDGRAYGPEEAVSREEAVRLHTAAPAYHTFDEDAKGTIEVGKLADFVIVGEDLFTIDADRIRHLPIVATIVGGETIYGTLAGASGDDPSANLAADRPEARPTNASATTGRRRQGRGSPARLPAGLAVQMASGDGGGRQETRGRWQGRGDRRHERHGEPREPGGRRQERQSERQDPGGGAIYAAMCARCHDDDGRERAPSVISLRDMSARAIYAALESGTMREQSMGLSADGKQAVAEWLARQPLVEEPMPATAYCAGQHLDGNEVPEGGRLRPAWSGWGGEPRGSGFVPTERAGLTVAGVQRLALKWAFGFADQVQTRVQPAVHGTQVIVGSQFGDLYSLDADSGCIHWRFEADAGVRGAVTIGPGPADPATVFFGDFLTNFYAVDAASGELVWRTRVGRHPQSALTGTAALHDGRLYVPVSSMEVFTAARPNYECCTSSGALVALDVADGAELWRFRVVAGEAVEVSRDGRGRRTLAPSGAPVWSSPTVDERRGVVYIGTGENYTRPATDTSDSIIAIDLDSGELVWKFQATRDDAWNLSCPRSVNCPDPPGPDLDFGMAPILTTRPDGREILVAGQKAGVVFAFDPDHGGELLWSTRIGRGGRLGGIHWGMATDGRLVYATNSDRFVGADPNPARPGVYALDPGSGEVVWQRPTPDGVCGDRRGCYRGNSAAPTVIDGVVFAGALDGHIRAYSTEDGSILWDFDTAREFETVNGVPARGGAVDGPAPVVAGGLLLVSSGYAFFDQMPGNVLLAFGVAEER